MRTYTLHTHAYIHIYTAWGSSTHVHTWIYTYIYTYIHSMGCADNEGLASIAMDLHAYIHTYIHTYTAWGVPTTRA